MIIIEPFSRFGSGKRGNKYLLLGCGEVNLRDLEP